MNMPGFTADIATYNRGAFFHTHEPVQSRPSAGTVAMAGYYYCGQCQLGYHACPNPDGFGCNVCVPLWEHCPPPR
jgi:hypothetical protein